VWHVICDAHRLHHVVYTNNTLQHAATRCNTLQHAATCCNTLQRSVTQDLCYLFICVTLTLWHTNNASCRIYKWVKSQIAHIGVWSCDTHGESCHTCECVMSHVHIVEWRHTWHKQVTSRVTIMNESYQSDVYMTWLDYLTRLVYGDMWRDSTISHDLYKSICDMTPLFDTTCIWRYIYDVTPLIDTTYIWRYVTWLNYLTRLVYGDIWRDSTIWLDLSGDTSCHAYEWIISHTWMRHVTYAHGSSDIPRNWMCS